MIYDMEFSVAPEMLRPMPGALDGLRRLQEAGYLLEVITNQSGVARGLFDEAGLKAFHDHMVRWFAGRGVCIAAVYYCPHYENGALEAYAVSCKCRKPEPGMLLQAAQDLGIDLSQSWMIGDRAADIGAGRAAGCRTIRIGHRTEPTEAADDAEVQDLSGAADFIL